MKVICYSVVLEENGEPSYEFNKKRFETLQEAKRWAKENINTLNEGEAFEIVTEKDSIFKTMIKR